MTFPVVHEDIAYHECRGQPKRGTDWRPLPTLTLRFPALKRPRGQALDCLRASGAATEVLATWHRLAALDIRRGTC